ncbi:hypothetical protein B5E92_12385 [Erysipelatoclostridium sp. An15]|uniref:lipopolysaccharide biosynthesis protein n=1 Tax=Erysipelatoclostridium sp. An15 TaxID=1965566 RepID=UPI000B395B2F|nr:hypothetical protein [Erysipelatoclostridium sp. An15]OUQ05207.1 hypothetical protein B5E92_12385 [Erysipelatoclostridium sp. An15]
MNIFSKKLKEINDNDRIVLKNTFFAFFIKGLALVISLMTTPAFISYFNNNEILGVWYTMLSVLTWFLNFDLGIGNGIRNNLTIALSENNRIKSKYIISSGLFISIIVSFVIFVIGIILLSFIDLNTLFNISKSIVSTETLYISTLFILFAIILRLILTSISAIFYAMQKSSINNFLTLCISVLQLLFVLIFRFDSMAESLINLSIAYMIFSNLPIVIGGIVIFSTNLKDCKPSVKYIEKKYIRIVLSIGGIFFICQILYMLIINTNEFLITNLFGPEYTTEYTFYYKITSLISTVVSLAMTPIWSVVTKAMTEKKWVWLNDLYKKIKKIGFLIIIFEFLLIPFMQILFDIWLGDRSIRIDYFIALSFACFGSVFVYSSMLSTIVCGLAKMRLQTICYTLGTIFKFIFILLISKYINNWSIVVWTNAIILLPYCVLQQIWLDKYFENKIREEKIL